MSTTIPSWATGLSTYPAYLAASQRCAEAFAPAEESFTIRPRRSRRGVELGGYVLHIDRDAAQVALPDLIPAHYDTADAAREAGRYYTSGEWARAQEADRAEREAALAAHFAERGQAAGMATEAQVRYILDLIATRRAAGTPDHPLVPTTIAGLASRTRAQASVHINDLTRS